MFPRRLLSITIATALLLGASLTTASADTQRAEKREATTQRSATAETTTVEYGPFTLPPAEEGADHHASETGFDLDVEKPCEDCYITGYAPDLVYEDGTDANVDTGPMLHHFVLFDTGEDDTVCAGPQRVFSSGNERVESRLPDGYGLRVEDGERWALNYDLMNQDTTEGKTVTISITFTHEPADSDLDPLTPLWLDVGGCFGSEYDAPEGVSEKSRYWRSTLSGELVHARGHLHHGGHSLWTENVSTGTTLCRITAEEGTSPEFIGLDGVARISAMPPCGDADSLGRIDRGDYLKTTSRYEIEGHAHDDVMGIMVGWLAED